MVSLLGKMFKVNHKLILLKQAIIKIYKLTAPLGTMSK